MITYQIKFKDGTTYHVKCGVDAIQDLELRIGSENIEEIFEVAPILSSDGFSQFWKSNCPELPWFKAMQKFHKAKANA